ncbi:hypothetical protein DFQ27_009767 [Actinomortierella ambigua]|uniref:Uncharacterized protein n=1 Tax=Actinomortierella ambigua TaxID=1343610 RepID=A0A9P6PP15_9FUNG|nr:hypothetical protein DFQ27_009767 [Actinomortierella ambigua]
MRFITVAVIAATVSAVAHAQDTTTTPSAEVTGTTSASVIATTTAAATTTGAPAGSSTAGPAPTGIIDPSYPFLPNGPCVSACTNESGKSLFPNYSEDPKSPYFIESMSYGLDSGSPKTAQFMGKNGMCMVKCPKSEQDLYTQQYPARKAWYAKIKAAQGGNGTATATGANPTPTEKPSGASQLSQGLMVAVMTALCASALAFV